MEHRGSVSPGASRFARSWERAELQKPEITKAWVALQRHCCARVVPWKREQLEGTGNNGSSSRSDPKPSLYPAKPPRAPAHFQTLRKGSQSLTPFTPIPILAPTQT